MKINQKGAIDMMLVAAVAVVLVVGGFVVYRISSDADTDDDASSKTEVIESEGSTEDTADDQPADGVEPAEDESGEETVSTENLLTEGTFSYSPTMEPEGTFRVEGYVTTVETPEAWCEGDDCGTNTTAFFNVVNTNNASILDYIADGAGNSFYGEQSFSIGCFIDGEYTWSNLNDSATDTSGTLSGESADALAGSDENNLVVLEATRYLYTSGQGAPSCYSHFTSYEVL